MDTRRTRLALFALITFVVGGTILPAVHRVDHVKQWYEQRAAAHEHGDPARKSVAEACDEVGTDLQHCILCHRDFFSDLVPQLEAVVSPLVEAHLPFAIERVSQAQSILSTIRGPPVKA